MIIQLILLTIVTTVRCRDVMTDSFDDIVVLDGLDNIYIILGDVCDIGYELLETTNVSSPHPGK